MIHIAAFALSDCDDQLIVDHLINQPEPRRLQFDFTPRSLADAIWGLSQHFFSFFANCCLCSDHKRRYA